MTESNNQEVLQSHPALDFYSRVEKRYPSIWSVADDLRQQFGSKVGYKDGCVFTKAEAQLLGMKLEKGKLAFSPIAMGALVAWRPTKGIYRYELSHR